MIVAFSGQIILLSQCVYINKKESRETIFILMGYCPRWSQCCKFGNFRDNFIFANSVKGHICDFQNSRLSHDLPISVQDRVILPFNEGFIFVKTSQFCENKTLAKNSEFTVY